MIGLSTPGGYPNGLVLSVHWLFLYIAYTIIPTTTTAIITPIIIIVTSL